jgi:hypothetical protein
MPPVFLYDLKYFYCNRITYYNVSQNEVLRIFLLNKLKSEEFRNFLYLDFVWVTLVPMPRSRRLFFFILFFFFGALNSCIMVEELHYRSYLKESKLLSDRR